MKLVRVAAGVATAFAVGFAVGVRYFDTIDEWIIGQRG